MNRRCYVPVFFIFQQIFVSTYDSELDRHGLCLHMVFSCRGHKINGITDRVIAFGAGRGEEGSARGTTKEGAQVRLNLHLLFRLSQSLHSSDFLTGT